MRSFSKILILSVFYAVFFTGCSDDDEDDPVIKWTTVSDSKFGTDTIRSIIYGDGKFVACGTNGKMAYSYDGKVWVAVDNNNFEDFSISSIAYGDGKFVACGSKVTISSNILGSITKYDCKIAYSYDGVNWTATVTGNFGIRCITYGDGKFVVGGTNGSIAYSTDGIKWTIAQDNKTNYNISSVSYGGGKFVAIANSEFSYSSFIGGYYSNDIVHSTDGVTWNKLDNGLGGKHYISCIAYGDGKFVIMRKSNGSGLARAYSYDGITWTDNQILISNNSNWYELPIYSIIYNDGVFVAGGQFNKTLYSYDGIKWNLNESGKLANVIYSIAYGNGKFVAGGTDGKIAYSNNH